jgi:hypothetical protein
MLLAEVDWNGRMEEQQWGPGGTQIFHSLFSFVI